MKILSYNIHKGFSATNSRCVLRQMREAIRAIDADIVFLQEVLGEHARHSRDVETWPSEAQFEFLADSIWPHFAYGKNAVYDEGHHGNAILSKYPIIHWANHDVSTNRLEQRGMLHAKLEIPGQTQNLHCICVHLGLTARGRRAQLATLCSMVEASIEAHSALVIAGDFNDWSRAATKFLQERLHVREVFRLTKGSHAATFPAQLPVLPLDRIYAGGCKIVEAHTLKGSPWSSMSDHTPLLAEIEII